MSLVCISHFVNNYYGVWNNLFKTTYLGIKMSLPMCKCGTGKIDNVLNNPEPPPIKNNHPAVWDLVLADMKERDEIGKQKYDTRLQPFNGRDPLVDAYQEALDLVVYLRQAIYERDNQGEKK